VPGELVGDREVRGLSLSKRERKVQTAGKSLWPAVTEFVEERE
jgi:hypothetical protein